MCVVLARATYDQNERCRRTVHGERHKLRFQQALCYTRARRVAQSAQWVAHGVCAISERERERASQRERESELEMFTQPTAAQQFVEERETRPHRLVIRAKVVGRECRRRCLPDCVQSDNDGRPEARSQRDKQRQLPGCHRLLLAIRAKKKKRGKEKSRTCRKEAQLSLDEP